jgi:hypothetical protein
VAWAAPVAQAQAAAVSPLPLAAAEIPLVVAWAACPEALAVDREVTSTSNRAASASKRTPSKRKIVWERKQKHGATAAIHLFYIHPSSAHSKEIPYLRGLAT